MTTPRRTQADRSRQTRRALMEAARPIFTERRFADVPADEIVHAAGVTRGALYHHFDGKLGLFRAVFEALESDLTDEVRAAAAAAPEPDRIVVALQTFLEICRRPEVVRIALTDAPAVLGWAEWRAIEGDHGLGLVRELLDEAAATGTLAARPTTALAHVVLSAVIEAALMMSHAEDPDAVRTETEEALLGVLGGLLTEDQAGSGGSSPRSMAR